MLLPPPCRLLCIYASQSWQWYQSSCLTLQLQRCLFVYWINLKPSNNTQTFADTHFFRVLYTCTIKKPSFKRRAVSERDAGDRWLKCRFNHAFHCLQTTTVSPSVKIQCPSAPDNHTASAGAFWSVCGCTHVGSFPCTWIGNLSLLVFEPNRTVNTLQYVF